MAFNSDFFLKKALGEDFLQSLEKFELWKPGTKTVLDHEEIRTALKIVPRAIMSLLISHLAPMNIGETKEIPLEINQSDPPDGVLHVTKHERDVYSGEIESSTEKYTDKKIAEFKYRSIPGIGLVIMSAFELYNVDDLEKETPAPADLQDKVQRMIDERLALHDLIGKVVNKKLEERDAIHQLLLAKISDSMRHEKHKDDIRTLRQVSEKSAPQSDPYFQGMTNGLEVASATLDEREPKFVEAPKRKGSPLKNFLEGRKNKLKKHEYAVELVKGENLSCPDCGHNIFDGKAFSGCVCLGDDMDKKIYLTKNESGFRVRFGKGWDPENIEMLLEVMRKRG